MTVILPLISVVVFNSLAQVCLKMAAMASGGASLWALFNVWLAACVACMGISFILWQFLIVRSPLSFLHPFCSLTYLLTPLLSVYLFRETVSPQYLAGIFLIMTGVYFTASGSISTPPDRRSQGEKKT
jgi:EamA-like transporter family.